MNPLTKPFYPLHYHVSRSSTKDGVEVKIIKDLAESRTEYDNNVQLVKDLTGSPIISTDQYITRFENLDIVKWRPCDRNCIPEEIGV